MKNNLPGKFVNRILLLFIGIIGRIGVLVFIGLLAYWVIGLFLFPAALATDLTNIGTLSHIGVILLIIGIMGLLIVGSTVVKLKGYKNQGNSNQNQSSRNLSPRDYIPELIEVHLAFLLNQTDKYKKNVPNINDSVKIKYHSASLYTSKPGDINNKPSQPADRFWQIPEILLNQMRLSFFEENNFITNQEC